MGVLRRSYRFLPAVFFMALIFWFSSLPANEVARAADPLYQRAPTINIGKPVQIPWLKVGHFIGYSGLGAALLYGFRPRSRWAVVFSIAVTLFYAVTDEIHQVYVPGRHSGINDILIDTGAAGVTILLIEVVQWIGRLLIYRRERKAKAAV